MTLRARLYTKPGCHLCEDTLADLDRLQRRHPHELELVDISRHPDLLVEYGERIPVLVIDGHEYDAPLLPAILEHALRQASAAARATTAARVESVTDSGARTPADGAAEGEATT